jgi:hypothetical protein
LKMWERRERRERREKMTEEMKEKGTGKEECKLSV